MSDQDEADRGRHTADTMEAAKTYRRKHQPGSVTLGKAALMRREILGMTQEDVADRFDGPSVASLRTIENAQSDNYRAKTLFALDSALSWPQGAAFVLLTGTADRLDHAFKQEMYNDFADLYANPISESDFDHFVESIVRVVSDADVKKYDIPVRSASNIPPIETPSSFEFNLSRHGTLAEPPPESTARRPLGAGLAALIPEPDADADLQDALSAVNRLPTSHLRELRNAVDYALRFRERAELHDEWHALMSELRAASIRCVELVEATAAAEDSMKDTVVARGLRIGLESANEALAAVRERERTVANRLLELDRRQQVSGNVDIDSSERGDDGER